MILYTFNFKNEDWGKSWILGIMISLSLLLCLEIFWRIHNHKPNVIDDHRLWSKEREKIGKSDKEIVLLGSSRMQTDISIAVLEELLPGYSIINLPVSGKCPNTVLQDLAKEKSFKGTVIVEITSHCIMFGEEDRLSQLNYVDYYHKRYNCNDKINRMIATFIEKKLNIVNPYLNLIKNAGKIFENDKLSKPNYLNSCENRTLDADYKNIDIDQHKAIRINRIKQNYKLLEPRISKSLFKQGVSKLEKAVKLIQKRSGIVVFVRFPVSKEHWDIDELYFPREKYWDPITSMTSANVIHFKDIETINSLECPDTSHLDVSDKAVFSMRLFEALVEHKII